MCMTIESDHDLKMTIENLFEHSFNIQLKFTDRRVC